jgi:hypothetical protein
VKNLHDLMYNCHCQVLEIQFSYAIHQMYFFVRKNFQLVTEYVLRTTYKEFTADLNNYTGIPAALK